MIKSCVSAGTSPFDVAHSIRWPSRRRVLPPALSQPHPRAVEGESDVDSYRERHEYCTTDQPAERCTLECGMAEGVGFEPTVPLQARRFSRPSETI